MAAAREDGERDGMKACLAASLRRARLSQGMSQEAVAHAAGVAVSTYARLERNHAWHEMNPTIKTLRSVSQALGIRLRLFLE